LRVLSIPGADPVNGGSARFLGQLHPGILIREKQQHVLHRIVSSRVSVLRAPDEETSFASLI
jgi:hypothetical protein